MDGQTDGRGVTLNAAPTEGRIITSTSNARNIGFVVIESILVHPE